MLTSLSLQAFRSPRSSVLSVLATMNCPLCTSTLSSSRPNWDRTEIREPVASVVTSTAEGTEGKIQVENGLNLSMHESDAGSNQLWSGQPEWHPTSFRCVGVEVQDGPCDLDT